MKKGELSKLPAELRAAVKQTAHALSRKDYEHHRTALGALAAERLRSGVALQAIIAELCVMAFDAMRRNP
jgi:hypothetical protein